VRHKYLDKFEVFFKKLKKYYSNIIRSFFKSHDTKRYFKKIKTIIMRFKKVELELFRKRVKMMIPQMEKSEIFKHFLKQKIPRFTIYSTIDQMQNTGKVSDAKRNGRPTSWTSDNKFELKRLVNNRIGVSQRKLGRIRTIGRQLKKMFIRYRKR